MQLVRKGRAPRTVVVLQCRDSAQEPGTPLRWWCSSAEAGKRREEADLWGAAWCTLHGVLKASNKQTVKQTNKQTCVQAEDSAVHVMPKQP